MKSNYFMNKFIIMLAFLLIMIGCKSIQMPTTGGGAINESTDPKEAVQTAYRKFMDAKSYSSSITTKNPKASVDTQLEFLAPDKFWVKNSVSGMKSEVIAIGNESFTRINESKWTKMPAGQSLPTSEIRGKMSEEAFAAMKDFEAAGSEKVNGKDALIYKFKSTYSGNTNSKMWISKDSGLPLKVESSGNIQGTSVEMFIVYDYDKEVKVEAPKVE